MTCFFLSVSTDEIGTRKKMESKDRIRNEGQPGSAVCLPRSRNSFDEWNWRSASRLSTRHCVLRAQVDPTYYTRQEGRSFTDPKKTPFCEADPRVVLDDCMGNNPDMPAKRPSRGC